MLKHSFLRDEEIVLCDEFLEKGYVIVDVEDKEDLDTIVTEVAGLAYPNETISDYQKALKSYHLIGNMTDFNSRKMTVANGINEQPWLRPTIYHLGKKYLDTLVGSQIAQQNKAILTVLMPEDSTSILPIHADVFSGETPYQVNQWIPLVDVEGTMSMFFLARKYSEIALQEMLENKYESMTALFDAYKDKLEFLTVPYGKQIFFCSNFFHGNVKNEMSNTRWAFHIRYANLLAPYRSPEKSLGNFYRSELIRPATQCGMAYDQLKERVEVSLSNAEVEKEASVSYEPVTKEEIATLRTYVSPRPFGPWRLPVPMQNILLRDYCEKINKIIKLPANELNIEDNHMVLNMTLDGIEEKQGIAMCSLEMLPADENERNNLLMKGLNKGSEWHFIFENTVISTTEDIESLNNLERLKALKT